MTEPRPSRRESNDDQGSRTREMVTQSDTTVNLRERARKAYHSRYQRDEEARLAEQAETLNNRRAIFADAMRDVLEVELTPERLANPDYTHTDEDLNLTFEIYRVDGLLFGMGDRAGDIHVWALCPDCNRPLKSWHIQSFEDLGRWLAQANAAPHCWGCRPRNAELSFVPTTEERLLAALRDFVSEQLADY